MTSQFPKKVTSHSSLLAFIVTVIGAAIAVLSSSNVDVPAAGPLGLIQVLPIGYFVGVGIVILAFVGTVRREHLVRPLLAFELATLIVLLFGLAAYTESVPRVGTSYVHAGFIEYIQRKGEVLKDYDARFVWPGFFAAGALFNLLAGLHDQSVILAWAPLAFNLGYALPVWVIARSTGAPSRVCWLATYLFFLLNWVGQDYYSPQGVNFILATSFLAVMLRVFFTDRGTVPSWAKKSIEPFIRRHFTRITNWLTNRNVTPSDTPPIPVSGGQKAAVIGALIIMYFASVVSHQLTPFFLIISTVGLVVLDRVEVRSLPVLMIVGVFIWISYAATAFWVGHINQLFGDVGNLGNVVGQNVGNRVTGNPHHLPVIYSRLLLAATVWLSAGLGFLRRVKRGHLDVLCVVGLIAPFAVLGGQAYGGEAILRVYLFGLPFAVVLAASLLAPGSGAWGKKTTCGVAVILLALLPTLMLTKYGNESFEAFATNDRTTVNKLMSIAPRKSHLISLNAGIPWRTAHIEDYSFDSPFDGSIPLDEPAALDKAMHPADGRPTYLILTGSQRKYAEMMQGQSPTWADGVVNRLLETGRYKIIYSYEDGEIIVPAEQP